MFERRRPGFVEGLVDDITNCDAGIWVNVVIVLQSTEQFRKPEPQAIVSVQINLEKKIVWKTKQRSKFGASYPNCMLKLMKIIKTVGFHNVEENDISV